MIPRTPDLLFQHNYVHDRWNLKAHYVAQAVLNGDMARAIDLAEQWNDLKQEVERLQQELEEEVIPNQ